MEPGIALEIQGLSKSYGALAVTQDVSVSVDAHQALGIIGPNGAGKTTLFNLIAGTVRADRGRIAVFGTDVSQCSVTERCHLGIARSFQVPQPFSGLTTYENILVAAAFGRRLTEREARSYAETALEVSGLAALADRQAGSLTLLNRKRLELARALATGPRLLLLDEIAGGLTEAECHALIALIREIRAGGTTIIWVEHVLHALLAVVDQVLVLDFGKVIAYGPPDRIMKDPQVAAVYLGPDAETLEATHV